MMENRRAEPNARDLRRRAERQRHQKKVSRKNVVPFGLRLLSFEMLIFSVALTLIVLAQFAK